MPTVPQTTSATKPSTQPKPPLPAPTEEQKNLVQDLASQLHYGFKAKPRHRGSERRRWEARFTRKFNSMLKILTIAQFDKLPPIAIGCVWENNRRLRNEEPKFDPSRVIIADSPGHPAYWAQSKGRLRYKPAFRGAMSVKPERDLRDNWWSEPIPPAKNTAPPQPHGTIPHPSGPSPDHTSNSDGERGADATDEGESEVDLEDEDGDVGDSSGARRSSRLQKTSEAASLHPVEGVAATKKPLAKAPTRQGAKGDRGSDMTVELATTRPGTSARRRGGVRAQQASDIPSEGIRGRTRSSSRGRAAAVPVSSAAAPSGANVKTTPPHASEIRSDDMRGRTRSSSRARAAAVPESPLAEPTAVKSKPSGSGKGKQKAPTKRTLYDLKEEPVKGEFVQHPRPCQKCQELGIPCMFNPLVRAYCVSCRERHNKCSNAFTTRTDHCMGTYLGWATYRMLSEPSIYEEPTFSSTNMPNPLPDDIDWFRELYDQERKHKTRKRKNSKALPVTVQTHETRSAARESSSVPVTVDVPHAQIRSGMRAGSVASQSTLVSHPPSATSVAVADSSACSIEEPPPSPSAISQTSQAETLNTMDVESPTGGKLVHNAIAAVGDGASVSESAVVEHQPPATTANTRATTDGPRRSGRNKPTRRSEDKALVLKTTSSEFDKATSLRRDLPPLPPAPKGAQRPVPGLHIVPMIPKSWKLLPRVGHRMADGFYTVIEAPHHDDWIAKWRALANSGRSHVAALERIQPSTTSDDAAPVARPHTPPSSTFTVSEEVRRLVQDTRARFDEIVRDRETMEFRSSLLRRESAQILQRQPWNEEDVGADFESPHITVKDLSSILSTLSEVHTMLARLADAFTIIPAVPVNWTAMLDLLTQIGDLRDLYRVSWERFAGLEEDVRPVREEIQRVRYSIAHVQDRLDQVSNDALQACGPIIHNLYQQLDTRISHLERGSPTSAPLPPTVGDILKILTRLSERVERLEQSSRGDNFQERVDEHISRYLADRGMRDDVLRSIASDSNRRIAEALPESGLQHPDREHDTTDLSAGSSISHVLRNIRGAPSPGSDIPAPPNTARLEPPLSRMSQRSRADAPGDVKSSSHLAKVPKTYVRSRGT